jgi:hypothetical protein
VPLDLPVDRCRCDTLLPLVGHLPPPLSLPSARWCAAPCQANAPRERVRVGLDLVADRATAAHHQPCQDSAVRCAKTRCHPPPPSAHSPHRQLQGGLGSTCSTMWVKQHVTQGNKAKHPHKNSARRAAVAVILGTVIVNALVPTMRTLPRPTNQVRSRVPSVRGALPFQLERKKNQDS